MEAAPKQPHREGGRWKWEESGELLQKWIWGKWGFGGHEYYPWGNFPCFAFSKTAANNDEWKGADRKCRGDFGASEAVAICQKAPQ